MGYMYIYILYNTGVYGYFTVLINIYSGPEPNHSDDGSSKWAADFPHDAWRDLMKPYIAAYKSGASAPVVEAEELVYWYRPSPKGASCTGDNLGIPTGANLMEDVVFASTMLTAPAELTVTSGNQAPKTITVPAGINTFNFTMGVGSQTFSVSRGGQVILGGRGGRDISSSCVIYNFNAYVGSFKSGSKPPTGSPTSQIPSSTPSSSSKPTSAPPTSAPPTTMKTTTPSSSAAPPTSSPGGDRKLKPHEILRYVD